MIEDNIDLTKTVMSSLFPISSSRVLNWGHAVQSAVVVNGFSNLFLKCLLARSILHERLFPVLLLSMPSRKVIVPWKSRKHHCLQRHKHV